MNETSTGMSWIWVLFVVIVLYVIFCRGGGIFGVCNGNGCNSVTNCEVERQELINTAQTQFLIGQEGSSTRSALRDTQDALMAQANRIYEQGLQERIFDLKAENMSLKNNIFTKEQTDGIAKALSDCCCQFNRRIDAIECQMLKTPPFFPTGSTFQGYSSCNACTNI